MGVSAVVVAAAVVAGLRFAEGYRLSRSGLHLVMLYVVALLIASQLVMALGETFRLSWWLYHLYLLVAVTAMLVAVGRQLQSGRLDDGLRALLDDDAERRLAYGLRPEVRALVVATEAKDPYTGGHMQRVAALAMRLGRALGLDPDDLRALGQAGVIYDVGKIEVPDAILNKPGRLHEGEYARVQDHPVAGERIARPRRRTRRFGWSRAMRERRSTPGSSARSGRRSPRRRPPRPAPRAAWVPRTPRVSPRAAPRA